MQYAHQKVFMLTESDQNNGKRPVGTVFDKGPGDLGSIPGCVTPTTQKIVLDTSLLNTRQYKVRIKGKVEQFRERSSGLPTHRCSSY